MTEKIQKFMNDNPATRWIALILIALAMFFGYMFVDVMSPLQSLVEQQRGWTPHVFGTYAAAEYILNVCGFLIIAGIILDKMGIRFTGILSSSMMFVGAAIKFIGISEWFQGTGFNAWLNTWWTTMPGSAKMAALGFMIFGCGCEMAGTTVSKSIAKWFKGKEMALAMGIEMAIARVGVFAIFSISPAIAEKVGSVAAPVGFCTVLLLIGVINFLVFSVMDKKFDNQLIKAGVLKAKEDRESEDEFHISDLGKVFSSKSFWTVAILCVLYYSAIFPFQRYGANMLQCNLNGLSPQQAANIFRWFPIGAAAITPFLGAYLDHKGKGATMLIWGAVLLIACHLIFAFVLPATHSKFIAYATIVVLGISFSLVPAALWPSVPKIIEEKILGSAYNLIFWVQNIGLCFVPLLIGTVLQSANANNEAVLAAKAAGEEFIPYDYTIPLIIFACFGILALIVALYLKALDKKRHLGLEEPNIKK
ncbi:MAG: MFS transporter [Bacteroidales bacterium]|nr:MFS transporter [Bacteroidales bacterium]MBR0122510.1 MFS transporter [Bacteroidales bacterium]